MPENYKVIQAAFPPREWTGNYGPMVSYDLTLEGVEGEVELAQKPTTPAPKQGDELFGSLEDGKFGKKFKKAQRDGGGFGGGGKSPDQQRSIVRQHSQEMALRYMAAKGITDFKLDDDFRKVIGWFQADAGGES